MSYKAGSNGQWGAIGLRLEIQRQVSSRTFGGRNLHLRLDRHFGRMGSADVPTSGRRGYSPQATLTETRG
jgi:hypothetical protein